MKQENNNPHRDFTRVPICIEAEIVTEGRRLICHETRDVCMKGLFAKTTETLQIGEDCVVIVRLGGPTSDLRIEVAGRVVRSDTEGLAVEFSEIGMDSYFHLKNLVLYNSENIEQAELEFKAHLGLLKKENS